MRAHIRQMMPVKDAPALALQRRLDFIQFQRGIFEERMAVFNDVKAETNVVGAVTGKGVETDFNPFHAPGLLGGGLFLHGFNNGTNEGDFVHNFNLLLMAVLICRIVTTLDVSAFFRSTKIGNHYAIFVRSATVRWMIATAARRLSCER
jgi:hypothetical protein